MADEKIKVCWITGSYNHGREVINKIKESLGDICIERYEDDVSAEYIEMQILGAGLFSDNRLIILQSLPAYSGSSTKSNSKWKDLLSNIPDDCTVIIDRVSAGSRRILYKHVKDIGKVFELPKYLKKVDASSHIENEFEKRGKSIDNEALALFVKKIGESNEGVDVDRIYMAIQQLCSYIGKRKKNISVEEVALGAPMNYSAIMWDIFDALDKRDFYESQRLFYNLCKISSIKDAVNQISSMMLWRYRLLLMVTEQKSNSVEDECIIKNILKLHKLSKEKTGKYIIENETKSLYGESVVNNMVKGFYSKPSPVKFYSRTEVFKIVKVIHECNLKLRDVDSDIGNLAMVDNMFMFICNVIEEDTLSKVRNIIDV